MNDFCQKCLRNAEEVGNNPSCMLATTLLTERSRGNLVQPNGNTIDAEDKISQDVISHQRNVEICPKVSTDENFKVVIEA